MDVQIALSFYEIQIAFIILETVDVPVEVTI